MDLQQFIEETLVQIARGIVAANKTLEGTGAIGPGSAGSTGSAGSQRASRGQTLCRGVVGSVSR